MPPVGDQPLLLSEERQVTLDSGMDSAWRRSRRSSCGAPCIWLLWGVCSWGLIAFVCTRHSQPALQGHSIRVRAVRSEDDLPVHGAGQFRPLLNRISDLALQAFPSWAHSSTHAAGKTLPAAEQPGGGGGRGSDASAVGAVLPEENDASQDSAHLRPGSADETSGAEAGDAAAVEAVSALLRGPTQTTGLRTTSTTTTRTITRSAGSTAPPAETAIPSSSSSSSTTTSAAPVSEFEKQALTLEQGATDGAKLLRADNLSYQEVLDLLPVTIFRRVDVENPVFPNISTRTLPAYIWHFDLLFGFDLTVTPGWIDTPPQSFADATDPRFMLVSPRAVQEFVDQCEQWLDASHNNRTVAFSILEVPLSEGFGADNASRAETKRRLDKFFQRIWYYSTDIEMPGVQTLPLGFTEMYMRERTDAMVEAYREADVTEERKTGMVLAAWGVYTKKDGHHTKVATKPSVMGYGTPGWAAVYNQAMDNRNDAEGWMSTEASKMAQVDFHMVPPADWWRELSRYKFLLSPIGTAIQCSRLPESLLMLTVPIIKRGPYRSHDDLIDLGFPIVVVDYWQQIKPSTLATWWRELSPKLKPFRRRCLTTEGYWRLFTTGRC